MRALELMNSFVVVIRPPHHRPPSRNFQFQDPGLIILGNAWDAPFLRAFPLPFVGSPTLEYLLTTSVGINLRRSRTSPNVLVGINEVTAKPFVPQR